MNHDTATQVWDQGIAWRLAVMVIGALAVVFILQRMGFRFVVAGSVKTGVG